MWTCGPFIHPLSSQFKWTFRFEPQHWQSPMFVVVLEQTFIQLCTSLLSSSHRSVIIDDYHDGWWPHNCSVCSLLCLPSSFSFLIIFLFCFVFRHLRIFNFASFFFFCCSRESRHTWEFDYFLVKFYLFYIQFNIYLLSSSFSFELEHAFFFILVRLVFTSANFACSITIATLVDKHTYIQTFVLDLAYLLAIYHCSYYCVYMYQGDCDVSLSSSDSSIPLPLSLCFSRILLPPSHCLLFSLICPLEITILNHN